MDIVKIYQDYNVPHITEGNKHCANGWVQTHCPYCTGSKNFHLGWNINESYFNCYRCGWHPPIQTISLLTGIAVPKLKAILPQYGVTTYKAKKPVKRLKKPLILPTSTTPLTRYHKKYLEGRGYDAEKLEKRWGLLSTGPLSNIKGTPYKHRILIPYNWNSEMVTFDTRDVTGKQEDKYKACPKEREKLERKEILYGNQEAWGSVGICVEGATDVWVFDNDYEGASFATSGIKFTQRQVQKIAQIFQVVFVVFDGEPQAKKQARKLVSELTLRGVIAKTVLLPKEIDPGSMPQKEANVFVKKLMEEGNQLLLEKWTKKS